MCTRGCRVGWGVAAIALVAASMAGAGSAAFPAPAGRILVSQESDELSLVLLAPESGAAIGVTFSPGIRSEAAFAPSGQAIALTVTGGFAAEGRDSEVAVVAFAQSGQPPTSNTSSEGRPAFSADGQRLVFASDRDGDWDLYSAPIGALDSATNLTADSPALERNPRLSPDGRRLAFESDRDGNLEVYVAAADGSGATNLTRNPADDERPDWAPDSSRLVFTSDRTGRGDLYVQAQAGGDAVRLTSDPWPDTRPSWSPDGRSIAFTAERDGDSEVFVIAPDGSGERRLTDNASEDLVQDWQPLFDTVAPTARALPGTLRRGRPLVFRFRAADNEALAGVQLQFSYRLRNGGGGGGASFSADLLPRLRAPGGGYAYSVPASFVRGRPASVRFCVAAIDAYLTPSPVSCTSYRFVKPKRR
jgi:Tol biopolymer transport system component